MEKGAQFLATRIGQDAMVIADLLQQNGQLQARVAELEKKLNPEPAPKAARQPRRSKPALNGHAPMEPAANAQP